MQKACLFNPKVLKKSPLLKENCPKACHFIDEMASFWKELCHFWKELCHFWKELP
jgi:hypothetical protein